MYIILEGNEECMTWRKGIAINGGRRQVESLLALGVEQLTKASLEGGLRGVGGPGWRHKLAARSPDPPGGWPQQPQDVLDRPSGAVGLRGDRGMASLLSTSRQGGTNLLSVRASPPHHGSVAQMLPLTMANVHTPL